jgi:integrase
LVAGADGDGYGLVVQQQKVRRSVYIPLPDGRDGQPDVVTALNSLPLKNEKYFFWDGAGESERVVNNWRSRLMKLFRLAESRTGEGKPFASKPHPHRFRYTFAAEYLSAGVPIETVSLLLGHAGVKVTERHYAKFNRARQERIDNAVRMAWKVKRPKLRVLKGGSQTVAWPNAGRR